MEPMRPSPSSDDTNDRLGSSRIDSNAIKPRRVAPFRSLVALVAVTALLVGCGVDVDTVAGKLPQGSGETATTTAAPTTKAPGTSAAPATSEPETSATTPPDTEPPETIVPPSTTSGGGGTGSLPAVAKEAFMRQCESGGQPAATCECIWGALEKQISIEDLMGAGSNGSLPADLQQKIVEATMQCLSVG